MTRSTTNQTTDMESLGGALVYVRKVYLDDLPSALQAEAREGGLEELYALHRADGEQVALVGDRNMAFHIARENQMTPVSVH